MPTPHDIARQWLDDPSAVILDTETTGLDTDDQVVEISIIDMQGNTLLDTLVQPTVPIGSRAQDVHGITAAHLVDAPTAGDLADTLASLLRDCRVITYNADFDRRLLRQSLQAHRRGLPRGVEFECAMLAYADWYQPRGRWQKLEAAAHQLRIEVDGQPHRALTDCRTTLDVIRAMAESPSYQDSPRRRGRAFEINETPKPRQPKVPAWIVFGSALGAVVVWILVMVL